MSKLTGSVVGVSMLAAVLIFATKGAGAQAQPRLLIQAFGSASQIGIGVREVTAEDAAKAKLAQPLGVYIESVRENSPAATAGLKPGDIVLDFDGERVRSASHFTRLVQETAPNRQVEVVVVRGTSKQTLKVVPETSNRLDDLLSNDNRREFRDRLRTLPPNFNFDLDPDVLRRAVPIAGATLGITAMPLTDQLASYFGVKQGVLVSSVNSDSPAAGADLKAGDVITAVNGRSVTSVGEVTRAIREARAGTVEITVTRDRKSMTLKAAVPSRAPRGSGRGGLPV